MTIYIGFRPTQNSGVRRAKVTDLGLTTRAVYERVETYETTSDHRLQGLIDGLKLAGVKVDWTDLADRGIL